jgi:hypothetical protein
VCQICIDRGDHADVTRRGMIAGAATAAVSGFALAPGQATAQTGGRMSFEQLVDFTP